MGLFSSASTLARSYFDTLTAPKAVGDSPTPNMVSVPETALWSQFSRIGGNLSPQGVSQIILEADSGSPSRLVDLFHECRQKDGTMQEVTSLRELAAASLDWSIELPPTAKRKDKKAAEALTEALNQCDTLPLLFAHSVGSGNAFGYGWSSARWERGTQGPLSGLLVPAEFTPVHSRRFGYRQADGKLVFLPDTGSSPDRDGVDLFADYAPGNFVGHFPRVNGDALVREGYGRMIVWMALFRNWDIRDWIQFGELGWKPWRLGFYDKALNASREDINILERAIKMLGATGAALLPKTVDFRVEWPKGGGANLQSTHAELAAFLGNEMAKGVLFGTLSADSGVKGARSLGEVHERTRNISRDFDAKGINDFMTRCVCKPFTLYNYGPGVIAGRFKCNIREAVDIEKLARAIDLLAGKLDIPQAWVRDQGGIPEPKAGDALVVNTNAKPAAASDNGKVDDTSQDDSTDDQKPVGSESKD